MLKNGLISFFVLALALQIGWKDLEKTEEIPPRPPLEQSILTSANTMSIDEVISLKQGGLSDSEILSELKKDRTRFGRVSPADYERLKKAGVGSQVINYIRRHSQGGLPTMPGVKKKKIPAGYVKHHNREEGYVIYYPRKWTKKIDDQGDVSFNSPRQGTSDIFPEHVGVSIENLPRKMSLNEYVNLSLKSIKNGSFSNLKILKREKINVNGLAGVKIVWTFQKGSIHFWLSQNLFVKERTAYIVSSMGLTTTKDQYRETFEKVSETFQLTKKEPSSSIKDNLFTSHIHHFSIQFPKSWTVVKGRGVKPVKAAQSATRRFSPNANVQIEIVPAGTTLEAYIKEALKKARQDIPSWTVKNQKEITIDGHRTKRVHSTFSMGGASLEIVQYILLKGKKVYIITMGGKPSDFTSMESTFDKIAQSFQFTK